MDPANRSPEQLDEQIDYLVQEWHVAQRDPAAHPIVSWISIVWLSSALCLTLVCFSGAIPFDIVESVPLAFYAYCFILFLILPLLLLLLPRAIASWNVAKMARLRQELESIAPFLPEDIQATPSPYIPHTPTYVRAPSTPGFTTRRRASASTLTHRLPVNSPSNPLYTNGSRRGGVDEANMSHIS
ncbi:hypothetical protein K523DRAFT_326260 [Schizophyllum commune Tattone D]|nr:hypothetical protein K523DRAFT_326260 [Schizophyllum commune Tattone D]